MYVDYSIPVPDGLPGYVQEEIDELDEYYKTDQLMYLMVEEAAYAHIKNCYAEGVIDSTEWNNLRRRLDGKA